MLLMTPADPVKGSISPIFIIAAAKSDLKVVGFLLYSETIESVDPPLNKT
jgi:hypothetical protein